MTRKGKTRLAAAVIYLLLIAACAAAVFLLGRITPPRTENPVSTAERGETSRAESCGEEPAAETVPVWQSTPSQAGYIRKRKPAGRHERPAETQESRREESEISETKPEVILASDLHYYSGSLTDYGEAFQNMEEADDGKITRYIPQITEAFLQEVIAERPAALILSGDLSLYGERAGHEELARRLTEVKEAGIAVLVIPGNHDVNHPNASSYMGAEKILVDHVSAEEFCEIYREFGYDQASSREETSLSYLYPLNDRYWIMMLDSCQYDPENRVGGRIRPETLLWMEERLCEAEEAGVTVIPVAHHNLLEESRLYREECTIENSREVIGLLEAARLPVFISGHLHLPKTKKYKPEPGAGEEEYHISEIVSGALGIPPCQYGILEWTQEGLSYHTRAVNVSGWAASGGVDEADLLNFEEFGDSFLARVIGSQVSRGIGNLPADLTRQMAVFYARIHGIYCAGKPIDKAEVRSDPAYRMWERNLPDSRRFEEMEDILNDAGADHNTWREESGK